jgi:general secretion pathway protein D
MDRATASKLTAPLLLLVLSCTSYTTVRQARAAEQRGEWDEAVLHYLEIASRRPDDLDVRASLLRAKVEASRAHFKKGRAYREAGSPQRALIELRQAAELDPTNSYAIVELQKVRDEIAALEGDQAVLTLEEMKRRARERSQPPILDPRADTPISLKFPNQTSVQDIYRALGKAYGINVLFDPNLKDQQIAIELDEVTAQDALEILMRAASHFYKVLDAHTILVAADTPQNRRIYEDQVIQTFFLSNADVKEVMTMLRSLVDTKKIAANEQLNAIIVRDSADKVRVAERIITSNDKAKAEVVIDVELLQLNTNKLREVGLGLSDYVATQSLDAGGEGVPIRLSDLEFLNQSSWTMTLPSLIYNFVKQDSDAQVLAKPQLRITEGEKAALHIGDRIPIPTTTFNSANTVGGSVVPITSFQYTDIGIKIDIEPRVHHNLEVSLKVKVEVSNLAGSIEGSGGQDQPIIGNRSIETTIRLKDGETNFLAGLIRTDESITESGIPGLSDIPLLGRLFSTTRRQNQRTDVLLTLTPHIIRKSDITEDDLLPIWIGTEQNISFRQGSPRVESEVTGPFDEETQTSAEKIQEAIRNRMRTLPRSLRDGAEEGGAALGGDPTLQEGGEQEDPAAPEAPRGIDLVPPAFPSSSFGNDEEKKPELEPELGPPVVGASTSGAAVDLHFATENPAVTVGQRFEVAIDIDARRELSHLPLRVLFDASLVRLVGWRSGPVLGSESEAEVLAYESESGVVLVGASRLGDRAGVVGEGTLLVLDFEALKPGSMRLSFDHVRALGPDQATLATDTSSLSLAIRAGGGGPIEQPDPVVGGVPRL